MTALPYPYASGDLLENRNTYFYTPFGGQAFLDAWRQQRSAMHSACIAHSVTTTPPVDDAPIVQRLRTLWTALRADDAPTADDRNTLDRILQRFEVSKRLHDDYTAAWRPVDPSRYHGLERYLLLAEVLGLAAASTGDLRYLNGLLKCLDTLTSMTSIDEQFGPRLGTVLEQERQLIGNLTAKVATQPHQAATVRQALPSAKPITLHGVGLIASPTARSQAYIQALVANGLHPAFVLLLGDHGTNTPDEAQENSSWNGIRLVNLAEPVMLTCQHAGIPVHTLPATSINEPAALEVIRQLQPHTLIYSGAGGQIVSPEALGLGARFLHMHAGHIPDYRGSTTIYYALLNGQSPAVTAIFLDAQIDTGGILACQHYPVPDRSIDIDRVYDASIRADTLVRRLHHYATTGAFEQAQPQQHDAGATYFVIHPVLKHLAILSLPEQPHG